MLRPLLLIFSISAAFFAGCAGSPAHVDPPGRTDPTAPEPRDDNTPDTAGTPAWNSADEERDSTPSPEPENTEEPADSESSSDSDDDYFDDSGSSDSDLEDDGADEDD